jgi:hypothetical protein
MVMLIRKYGVDYGRRALLAKGVGLAAAGVLAPLWPLISKSADITKAYPEELLSVEAYTKGAIKTGDLVTAANVEHVQNLLTPIAYRQVKEMGRQIRIVPTVTDVTKMFPHAFLNATLSNQGKGRLDADGNVTTVTGGKWLGGLPFTEPKSALEVFSNLTLSWGRHDNAVYAIADQDLDPDGEISYEYDFVWIEENVACRIGGIGPYGGPQHADKLRYQTVMLTAPSDVKATSYLSTWYYDQRKFPDLVGYVPAFKRVRKFPTNQRFEPLVPGMTIYLSDAWAAGDPMLTWGDYKIIGRQPMLGAVSENWHGDRDNYLPPVHGGQKGKTFYEFNMSMVPETIVIEASPTGYPRAPVGKKRVWVDPRNMQFVGYETYDRRGASLKSFEPSGGQWIKGDTIVKEADGSPVWTWSGVMSHDIQTNRMTRFTHTKAIDGVASGVNLDGLYEKYLTAQAIGRLGT